MKKAATLLALLAMSGSANAVIDNNVKDATEAGVDCDATAATAGGTVARQCDCRTDLTRTWSPPLLINTGFNRDSSDAAASRETGIVSGPAIGSAAQLEVAVALDGGVYVSAFGPDLTTRTTDSVAYDLMLPNTAKLESHPYSDPQLWFVNQADDTALDKCTFTVNGASTYSFGPDDTDNSGGGDDVAIDRGLTIERLYSGAVPGLADNVLMSYGVAGADCANGKYVVSARIDVRTALRECGFTRTPSATTRPTNGANDAPTEAATGENGVVSGSSYTEFLGKFKVQQTRQNGALRTIETVLKEDYPFQITILFPENIQVSSTDISVIGQAQTQATITHQIFDSSNGHVDVNVLFGTTYPYAVAPETLYKTPEVAASPSADTYIDQADPSTSFDDATTLAVDASTNAVKQSIVQFPISYGSGAGQIPSASSTILSAYLSIKAVGAGFVPDVHGLVASFPASGATYTGTSGVDADNTEATTASTAGGGETQADVTYKIDVTQFVENFVAGGATTAGFLLNANGAGSSEFYSANSDSAPRLVIEYQGQEHASYLKMLNKAEEQAVTDDTEITTPVLDGPCTTSTFLTYDATTEAAINTAANTALTIGTGATEFLKTDLTNLQAVPYFKYCTTLEETDGSGGTPAIAGEGTHYKASHATAQTTTGYRDQNLCDLSTNGGLAPGNGACGTEDVFTIVGTGAGLTTPYPTDSTAFNTDSPGGTDLPKTRCVGVNDASGTDAKACLQNIHFRLEPKGWCDLTGTYQVAVNAVCRDDRDGDGIIGETGDSLVQDSWDGSEVQIDPRTADSTPTWHHLATSQKRLFQTNGNILPCSSKDYRDSLNPTQMLTFTLASDDFCARVIATGEIEKGMKIYDSENGVATWGANIGGVAGDATVTDSTLKRIAEGVATSDACTASDLAATLCTQVPLYEPSVGTAVTTRSVQDKFVFGTTAYLETLVYAKAGVNLASTTIRSLHVASTGYTAAVTSATATDDDQDTVWIKKLYTSDGSETLATLTSFLGNAPVSPTTKVAVSDKITAAEFPTGSAAGNSMIGGKPNFFTTNPSAGTTNGAKLGDYFEGVSRASVLMDEFTIRISDSANDGSQFEAPEGVVFYATIDIEYKAADLQAALGARTVQTSSAVPASKADRARALAAGAVTSGQASATASVGRTATAGSSGASSNIAGMSATTVLAAASVLGAIVVAAGASFFVARKRRATAARTAKRSSSSTELNDTLAVQA